MGGCLSNGRGEEGLSGGTLTYVFSRVWRSAEEGKGHEQVVYNVFVNKTRDWKGIMVRLVTSRGRNANNLFCQRASAAFPLFFLFFLFFFTPSFFTRYSPLGALDQVLDVIWCCTGPLFQRLHQISSPRREMGPNGGLAVAVPPGTGVHSAWALG